MPSSYKNCAALNKKYPNGDGKVGARDKTSGEPVRTFKRSNRLDRVAMSHNKARAYLRLLADPRDAVEHAP